MFETLTDRFDNIFKGLKGRGKLSADDVDEALREIRRALLEADVNLDVAKNLTGRIRDRAVGEELSKALNPGQQIIKIVLEELTTSLGGEAMKITYASKPPTVVLMAGLQGAGKTTNTGKLAMWFKKQGRNPLLVGADLQRPAAVEQLRTLGGQVGVPVFSEPTDPVDVARKADDACEAPRELVAQAADFGLASLGIPAELGGFVEERSAVTAVLAAEALAHGDLGIAAAIMSTGAVATVVALHGTETQQQMWLPAFLGDDAPHAALCLAEPRVLDDPMRPTTTARRDGEGWILDGTKSFVPNGTGADLLLVSATTPDGVGLFVVETSAAGVAAKDDPMMGARALATTQVALTAVRVGNDALLGDEPSRDVLADVVARGRVGWAALAVGCGQAVLDLLIPYVNERQAFGEPIAHRQGVAFEISDIAVELDGLRLATYRAASLADRSSDLTDTAFRRAAAVAAQLVTTHAVEIGSMGVQLLGGHGYVKEHPVERWYRDLRVAGLAHGVLAV